MNGICWNVRITWMKCPKDWVRRSKSEKESIGESIRAKNESERDRVCTWKYSEKQCFHRIYGTCAIARFHIWLSDSDGVWVYFNACLKAIQYLDSVIHSHAHTCILCSPQEQTNTNKYPSILLQVNNVRRRTVLEREIHFKALTQCLIWMGK